MHLLTTLSGLRYGIFDVDGTLVDSMTQCGDIFSAVLHERHGVPPDESRIRYFALWLPTMADLFMHVLAERGIAVTPLEAAALHAEFSRRFHEHDVPQFEGISHMLGTLTGSQFTLFASSAAEDNAVWKRIVHGGLGHHFRVAYGSTLAQKGPAHIAAFASLMHEDVATFCRHAFWCGDAEQDMRIAKTAGMLAIGVRGTVNDDRLVAAGADLIVDTAAHLVMVAA